MNVNNVLTKEYENRTLGQHGKNEPKTNPNEPKINPTCRGVASGEAGSNPTCSELACPARPEPFEGSAVEGVEPISKEVQ